MPELLLERREHVCLLTLNRPESLNALNRPLLMQLREAIAELAGDRTVRTLVVTGAGRAFSAGADLKERAGMVPDEVLAFIRLIGDTFTALATLPQLTIAAVNGLALGGGTELALACDVRVTSPDATLGLTEARLGIIPGAGGTQRLPRLVGPAFAKEMILTGRKVTASEAVHMGLANRVSEDPVATALALADEVRLCAPISVEQAKRAIDGGLEQELTAGLELERACYDVCLPTRDRQEALAAFRDKRPPQFKGE